MSYGIATFTIVGRIAMEPKVDQLANGTPRLSVSIAVEIPYQDKESQKWEAKTSWFRFSWFGKKAEQYGDRLKKGMWIQCLGDIQSRSEEHGDKKLTMYNFRPNMFRWDTLAGRTQTSASAPGSSEQAAPAQGEIPDAVEPTGEAATETAVPTDEIPF